MHKDGTNNGINAKQHQDAINIRAEYYMSRDKTTEPGQAEYYIATPLHYGDSGTKDLTTKHGHYEFFNITVKKKKPHAAPRKNSIETIDTASMCHSKARYWVLLLNAPPCFFNC